MPRCNRGRHSPIQRPCSHGQLRRRRLTLHPRLVQPRRKGPPGRSDSSSTPRASDRCPSKGNTAGGQKDGFFGNENYRKALQLTIRVRYLYEMRIPFADWIIQTCWLAANAPSYLQVSGALGRESAGAAGFGAKNAVSGGNNSLTTDELAAVAAVISPGAGNGKPIVSRLDYAKLVLARQNGWYLFPLSASYTMRMQSNFYRKHLDN